MTRFTDIRNNANKATLLVIDNGSKRSFVFYRVYQTYCFVFGLSTILRKKKQLKDIEILSIFYNHMRQDFPTKAFSNLIMLI